MTNRSRKEDEVRDMEVNLNLFTTPMLDMAFQLLAFFIMFYKPGLLIEGYVNGKLLPPEKVAIQSKTAKKKEVDPKEKTDIPPDDVKDKVTVFIKAVAKGQREGDRGPGELSQILITIGKTLDSETIADSTDELDAGLKNLSKRLKKIRDGPSGESSVIHLQPDGNLRYQFVVVVWNTCRGSGFDAIGFGAPTNEGK